MKKQQFATLLCIVLLVSGHSAQEKKGIKEIPLFARSLQQNKAGIQNAKSTIVTVPGRSSNYYWSTQNLSWGFADTSYYFYNASGMITSETRQDVVPYTRTLNTYDAQGRLTQAIYQTWSTFSNNWLNQNRNVYVYDSQNYQIEYRGDTYNTSTNQWETMYGQKNLLTYNASNRITDNIYQSWNSTTELWEFDYRETAILYDANGNLTQYDGYFYNGSTWEKDNRLKLTYSLNNKPVEAVFQIWNGNAYSNAERYTNMTWNNWCGFYCDQSALSTTTLQSWGSILPNQWNTLGRINTTYDNYGGYMQVFQDYLLAVWVNNNRYTKSYDTHFNSTGYKFESWDISGNVWIIDDEEKIIHTYNGASNLTQSIWQFWNSNTNTLENNERRDYFDFQLTGINEWIQFASNSVVYPNPCSDICYLNLNEKLNTNSSETSVLRLFDAKGQEVLNKLVSFTEMSFGISDLPPGLYLYTLSTEQKRLTKGKLLVQ